jgi:thiamine-monophosphate kinase
MEPLGPVREFEEIRSFLKDLPAADGVRLGPGDDGAVLGDGTVISTDLSVEGVHFRLDWVTPEEAGARAVAAALSDLAAMAAEPLGVLVSIAVPRAGEGAGPFMMGVRGCLDHLAIPLLGGDLSRSPGPVFLDVVAIGRSEAPLLRSGSRPGDEVWVTGALGGAAAAVQGWLAGSDPSPQAREAFSYPRPRIREALWLRAHAPLSAGLDLSDGILGDAGHLAAASAVRIELWIDRIPIHPGCPSGPPWAGLLAASHPPLWSRGEDYELLLTAPAGGISPWVEEFRRIFDLSLTQVGCVGEGEGVWIRSAEGTGDAFRAGGGWDHFGGVEEESEEGIS